MMTKKDLTLVAVIGAAVGLLVQPILANTVSLASAGTMARVGVFFFFLILAPLALWIASLISRWFRGLYQFAEFAAVGSLNSFIDIGVFNIETFFYGTSIIGTALFALFKAISFLFATTNSFFWNKYWTFSTDRASHPEGAIKETKEATSFYIIAAIGWALNVGVATLVKLAEPSGATAKLWVNIVAPLAGVAASFLWDFFGYKYLVFKKASA
jgi:putative flippase GtrA